MMIIHCFFIIIYFIIIYNIIFNLFFILKNKIKYENNNKAKTTGE
jgi:hypothetical protein